MKRAVIAGCITATLFAACGDVEGWHSNSEIYCFTAGETNMDCETFEVTGAGFTFKLKEYPNAPTIKDGKFKFGYDTNCNKALDDDEVDVCLPAPMGGRCWTLGGFTVTPPAGSDLSNYKKPLGELVINPTAGAPISQRFGVNHN